MATRREFTQYAAGGIVGAVLDTVLGPERIEAKSLLNFTHIPQLSPHNIYDKFHTVANMINMAPNKEVDSNQIEYGFLTSNLHLSRSPGGRKSELRREGSLLRYVDAGNGWVQLVGDVRKTGEVKQYGTGLYAQRSNLLELQPELLKPIAFQPGEERWIEVNLTDQKMYLHSRINGKDLPIPMMEAQISSGVSGHETPAGEFILSTQRIARRMSDGITYDLDGVPFVQYFKRKGGQDTGVAFHGTYWHNKFGQRMSHGCVNLSTPDALKLWLMTNPEQMGFSEQERGYNREIRVNIHY